MNPNYLINITKLITQSDAGFERSTGIQKATFQAMQETPQEHEASKRKSGRPSELSLEFQIRLALTYGREYRTLYHIGMDFGVHEPSTSCMVKKAEDDLKVI